MKLDAVYIMGLDDGENNEKFECTIGMFCDDVFSCDLNREIERSVWKSGRRIVFW